MGLKSDLPAALKYQALIIETAARDAGLDFFDVVFELLDAKDVNGVAAYGGFPVRYPSWRFGMEYERLEKGRFWGLSKIYELVINNNPTYAYLVRSNSLLEQKLVMAHVYGHADFFKNNLWFGPTDRKMLDTMGHHSTRVRRYIDAVGLEAVETFMDRVLSLDTLVDPYLPQRGTNASNAAKPVHTPASERALRMLEALSTSPVPAGEQAVAEAAPEVGVRLPTYDVLGFLGERGSLEPWQRDIVEIVRAEAYYFVPQRMTKIMNEGWASYWHSKLLTEGLLDPSEVLDFADCHSSATAGGRSLNPYKMGIELYRHAERRGEDIFQLRRVHNDVSLVHKLVDQDFAERNLRSLFPQRTPEGEPIEFDWRVAKAWMLQQLSWGGLPQIQLVSDREFGADELVLLHHHDGRDLQMGQAVETLRNLAALWQGPVHLLTVLEGEGKRVVVEGEEIRDVDCPEALERCSGEAERPARAG